MPKPTEYKFKSSETAGLPHREDIADICNRLKLEYSDRLILLVLRSWMIKGKRLQAWPTQADLAFMLGLTTRQIRNITNKLIDLGLIIERKHRNGKPDQKNLKEYSFIYPWTFELKPETQTSGLKGDHAETQTSGLEPETQTSGLDGLKPETRISLPIHTGNKRKNRKEKSSSKQKLEEETPSFFLNSKNQQTAKPENLDLAAYPEKREKFSVSPEPVEPANLAKVLEQIPVEFVKDISGWNGDFDLSMISRGFIKRVEPDKNLPEPIRSQFSDFYSKCISAYWRGSKEPSAGFKMCFTRAYQAGFLWHFGFHPLSQAEIAKTEENEMTRKRLDDTLRWQRESSEKMQQEKIIKFIDENEWMVNYLKRGDVDLMTYGGAYHPLEVLDHLRQIKKKHLLNGNGDLEQFCTVPGFRSEAMRKFEIECIVNGGDYPEG